MKEKELLKGTCYNVKKGFNISAITIIILGILLYTLTILKECSTKYSLMLDDFGSFGNAWFQCLFGKDPKYGILFGGYNAAPLTIIPAIVISVLVLFVKVWLANMEITVTDKRVYGKAAFGRRVELPLDSISAISISPFKGIAIASSSGRIKFKLIKNNEEVYKIISHLLQGRQQYTKNITTLANDEQSIIDNIDKYKKLMDTGVITEEEFEAKKKQLLNL